MFKKLLSFAALVLCAGSSFAKEDVTSTYLTNADLTSLEGWTIYKADDAIGGNNGYTDWKTDGATPVIEFYHSWSSKPGTAIGNTKSFDFAQTVTLPAGYYRLKVNAFYREGNGGSTSQEKAFIYATTKTEGYDYQKYIGTWSSLSGYNGSNELYQAADAFNKGNFANEFDFDVTADNTEVTVGFHGYIDTFCSWCILGPVTLYKYEIGDFTEDFNTKVEEAKGLYHEKMDTHVLATLKTCAEVDQTAWKTKEQISRAYNELCEAIKGAKESISSYSTQNAKAEYLYYKMIAINHEAQAKALKESFDTAYDKGVLNGEMSEFEEAWGNMLSNDLKNAQSMTGKIVNPSFEEGSTNGWTVTDFNSAIASNGNFVGHIDGSYFIEKWCWAGNSATLADGSVTQTVTLPAGEYYLFADAKCEMQNGNTAEKGFFVIIGDKEYEVNSLGGEECIVYYKNETKGDVTIGVKLSSCSGNWVCADNFRLKYVGDLDTSVLEQLIKDAEALNKTLDDTKSYAQDLDQAIVNTKNALKTVSTLEEVESLTKTLQGYIDAAKLGARKDTYAVMPEGQYIIAIQDEEDGTYKFLGAGNNWGTQASLIAHPQYVTITKAEDGKYYVESQVNNGGDSKYFNGGWMDGTKTAFEFIGEQMIEGMDYYTVQLSNGTNYYYNNNGLVDNKAEADFEDGPQLWAVMSVEAYEAMVGSDASEEGPADFTHRILDADLGRNNVNVDAWTITDATNPKTSGEVSSANANFCIEAYKAKFNVVQTITGLPEGLYELKATAMYRQDGTDPVLPYIFIEDAKADFAERTGTENDMSGAAASMATGLYTVSARAYVGEDGTINIGAATEGTTCWAIFDNFQLYYLGEMTLTEYNRATAAGKYGTICLPYAAATEDATVYSAAIDGTEVVLTAVEAMEAGKSYIFLANKDNVKFSQVPGGIVDAPVSSLPLVGVCVPTLVPVGDYVLQTQDGVQNFYKVVEGAQPTLGDCKAYLTAPAASDAKVLSFANATAIKAIDALTSGTAKIYDLNGRELKSLQKGVNIVNGVKVMVK